ncbi:hypothetical protein SAMN05428954_2891 [Streptomyces sp. 2112.3]|nr:hypothetical protein SAMN05428954_2891 [Streptomyces sp. 2112.3]
MVVPAHRRFLVPADETRPRPSSGASRGRPVMASPMALNGGLDGDLDGDLDGSPDEARLDGIAARANGPAAWP